MTISEKSKYILWGKSAGRCQICNKLVYEDSMTLENLNLAELAHIIARSNDGPRGDKNLSIDCKDDISNIMLLCREHHKKIDTSAFIDKYPIEKLREIKNKHEERIRRITNIKENKSSHVILYCSNIANSNNPVNRKLAEEAMLNEGRFPAENNPISIHLKGRDSNDYEESFWNIERNNLQNKFNSLIKTRIEEGEIEHVSVFALAKIPLLIELGRLLSDKMKVDVYQLHREPQAWAWQKSQSDDGFEYIIEQPIFKNNSKVALVISFSGTIEEECITKKLGNNCSIWHMRIQNPDNDFLTSKSRLDLFRIKMRKLLNLIKESHPNSNVIHVFPAIPVAVAIEIGRVWMPKADMSLLLYDRNRNEFVTTFQIG